MCVCGMCLRVSVCFACVCVCVEGLLLPCVFTVRNLLSAVCKVGALLHQRCAECGGGAGVAEGAA